MIKHIAMNHRETALEKLRALVDAQGWPAAFARAWSKNPEEKAINHTYISQLLGKHRAFGEIARINMARRCLLPDDYFDRDDTQCCNRPRLQAKMVAEASPAPWPHEDTDDLLETLRIMRQLPPRAHLEILGAVRVIAASYGVRSRARHTKDQQLQGNPG